MDHTLVQYHIPNLYKLIHKMMVDNLVQQGFPRSVFDVAFDPSLVGKGLILDLDTGDLIEVDSDGIVTSARHGTSHILSPKEIDQRYGRHRQWGYFELLEKQQRHPNFAAFLTHFDVPVQHVCSLLVDYYDKMTWHRYDFWPKVTQTTPTPPQKKQHIHNTHTHTHTHTHRQTHHVTHHTHHTTHTTHHTISHQPRS